MIRFGPGGNSDSFYEEGQKSTLDVPRWLFDRGLNAYEYQCTRGVRITQAFAQALKVQAERFDIALSIHAPYYINLSGTDPVLLEKSRHHLVKSLQAAKWMGATRVVFHPGSASKLPRSEALLLAGRFLDNFLANIDDELLENCDLCPETMGKRNQLGSLEEVLALCKLHPRIRPAVDFGHLHARGGGSLLEEKDFEIILEKIDQHLGKEAVENLHVHFSPVEFTGAGEKKHGTLKDKEFGPDFYPLAKVLKQNKLRPTVICESAGTQAEDAAAFKSLYHSI